MFGLLELAEKKLCGIYHVSGSSIMSRLEFAKALTKEFSLDEKLLVPVSITDFNWKSSRPKNGGLVVEKISKIENILAFQALDLLDKNNSSLRSGMF